MYVHESADFSRARAIVMNAKTQRVRRVQRLRVAARRPFGGGEFLPEMLSELNAAGVLVHGDETVRDLAFITGFVDATDDD